MKKHIFLFFVFQSVSCDPVLDVKRFLLQHGGFEVPMEAQTVKELVYLRGEPPKEYPTRLGKLTIEGNQTGLMLAAKEGNLPLVTLFVENGADVNARDSEGGTALILAANHYPIAKYLIENGADVNIAKEKTKSTALTEASKKGNLRVIKLLVVERDADLNKRNATGSTALGIAVENGFMDIIEYLVEQRGMPLNEKTKGGLNLLMLAAMGNQPNIISYLVEKGFPLNERAKYGQTALSVAETYQNHKAAQRLKELGAKM